MTLCEIATANNQAAPLECAMFETESQAPGRLSSDRSHRACVESVFRLYFYTHIIAEVRIEEPFPEVLSIGQATPATFAKSVGTLAMTRI